VPVEFLSDEQVAAYGRFDGVPSRAELERFFLQDADRRRVVWTRPERPTGLFDHAVARLRAKKGLDFGGATFSPAS